MVSLMFLGFNQLIAVKMRVKSFWRHQNVPGEQQELKHVVSTAGWIIGKSGSRIRFQMLRLRHPHVQLQGQRVTAAHSGDGNGQSSSERRGTKPQKPWKRSKPQILGN